MKNRNRICILLLAVVLALAVPSIAARAATPVNHALNATVLQAWNEHGVDSPNGEGPENLFDEDHTMTKWCVAPDNGQTPVMNSWVVFKTQRPVPHEVQYLKAYHARNAENDDRNGCGNTRDFSLEVFAGTGVPTAADYANDSKWKTIGQTKNNPNDYTGAVTLTRLDWTDIPHSAQYFRFHITRNHSDEASPRLDGIVRVYGLELLDLPQYKVTVSHGTANLPDAAKGEVVTVTADPPPEGLFFSHWDAPDLNLREWDKEQNPMTFTMPNRPVTLTAIYAKPGMEPIFTPADGVVELGETVTIWAKEGAKVYYTLDGTIPTTASSEYTKPIHITCDSRLRAIAVDGDVTGSVTSMDYSVTYKERDIQFLNRNSDLMTNDTIILPKSLEAADQVVLGEDYYLVQENMTLRNVTVQQGYAHLHILDGVTLTIADGCGIRVEPGKTLNIWYAAPDTAEILQNTGRIKTPYIGAPDAETDFGRVYLHGVRMTADHVGGKNGKLLFTAGTLEAGEITAADMDNRIEETENAVTLVRTRLTSDDVRQGLSRGVLLEPGKTVLAGERSISYPITIPDGYFFRADSLKLLPGGSITVEAGGTLQTPRDVPYESQVTVQDGGTWIREEPAKVDGVYQLGTREELHWFCVHTHSGVGPHAAKLTADIICQPDDVGFGSKQNPFSGTFDGGGHALTVNRTAEENPTGLIAMATGDVEIKNLTLHGTVHGGAKAKFAASFLSEYFCTNGSVKMTNCYSDMVITSEMGTADSIADGTHGGLIGAIILTCTDDIVPVTLTNCAFAGSIVAEHANCCAGLIGYTHSDDLTINNCYVAADFQFGVEGSATLFRSERCYPIITNVYVRDDFPAGMKNQAESKPAAFFTNGAACWQLNEQKKDGPWRQNLGQDMAPVLDERHNKVVKVGDGYENQTLTLVSVDGNGTFTLNVQGEQLVNTTAYAAVYEQNGRMKKVVRVEITKTGELTGRNDAYTVGDRFTVMVLKEQNPVCKALRWQAST